MTNVPYNRNIPFATNNPSEDQPRMQENTNSLEDLIQIDHVGFGETQGGYHKDIRQPFRVGDPAAVLNVGQVYVKNVTENSATDTQLFFRTGNGGVSQLTGSSNAVNGFQHLGGVIIQWGRQAVPTPGGTVTYQIPFPTSVLNIQLTLELSTLTATNQSILINSLTPPNATDFQYISTATGATVFVNWVAIGT